jgi:ABC-type transporter Mla subunit MlaD
MLNAAKLIPVARTSVAPVLQQRSEQLVALINQWDTDQAKKIFADNVHLDESFERRCDAARKMIAESGPALIQAIVATSNTEAVIFLTNSKKIEILIGPLHSGPIQWYEVK